MCIVFIYIYVRLDAFTYAPLCLFYLLTFMCTFMYTSVHKYTFIYINAYLCTYVYIYVRRCTFMFIDVHLCTSMYTYMHIKKGKFVLFNDASRAH